MDDTSDALKQAALKELASRELAARGAPGTASVTVGKPTILSSTPDSSPPVAAPAPAAGSPPTALATPEPSLFDKLKAMGERGVTSYQNAVTDRAKTLLYTGKPAVGVALSKLYSAIPGVRPDQLESTDRFKQGRYDLQNYLGIPGELVAEQLLQMAPAAVVPFAGEAGAGVMGLRSAGTAVAGSVPAAALRLAKLFGQGTAGSAAANAAYAGLGAPEGQRADAVKEAVTSPVNLLYGAIAPLEAVPGMIHRPQPSPHVEPTFPTRTDLVGRADKMYADHVAEMQTSPDQPIFKSAQAPLAEKPATVVARARAQLAQPMEAQGTPLATTGAESAKLLPGNEPTQLAAHEILDRADSVRQGMATVPGSVEKPSGPLPPDAEVANAMNTLATGGRPELQDMQSAAALRGLTQVAQNGLAQVAAFRQPGLLARLSKALIAPEFRADPTEAAAIRSYDAAKRIQDINMARMYPKLRASEKANLPLIQRFVRQQLNPENNLGLQVPVEALPHDFQMQFKAGTDIAANQRDELIAKGGYFSDDQLGRMAQAKSENRYWLHRDYLNFLDKGYLPDPGLFEKGVQWVVQNGKQNSADAVNLVQNALEPAPGKSPLERFQASTLNKDVLKNRVAMPMIFKKLLGEIESPSFVVANSFAQVDRLWRQMKVTEAFTAPDLKGKIWDDKPSLNLDWRQVPDDKKSFGEFAGKYLAPQLFESVMLAPAAEHGNVVARVLAPVNAVFKVGKVLINPVRYMTNWMQNSAYSAAAGLPIWDPAWAKYMTKSAQAMLDYHGSFLTPKGSTAGLPTSPALWYQWAIEDGAVRPGLGGEAGGGYARAIARRYLRAPQEGIAGFLKATKDIAAGATAKAGELYDAADQHWRAAVYINQVEKGIERNNLSLAAARARASAIVNENFASSGTASSSVHNAAKYLGAIGPFMTFHADNLRVHLNWLKDGVQSGLTPGSAIPNSPEAMQNIANFTGSGEGAGRAFNVAMHFVFVGAVAELMKRIYGITDSEEQQARAKLDNNYKKSNPLPMMLPYRDSRGRSQFVSLGPSFVPTDSFMKGDPNRSLVTRAFTNTLMGFVQSGAFEAPVQRWLADAGLMDPPIESRTLPGQAPTKFLEDAYKLMAPVALEQARTMARRSEFAAYLGKLSGSPAVESLAGGPRKQGEEPLTPGQTALYMTPARVEPAGDISAEHNRKTDQAEIRAAMAAQKIIPHTANTPQEMDRLRAAARARLDELQGQRVKTMQLFKK